MQLPLFYKKIVPLNREQHKNLYIEPVEGFGFAAGTNSLYIAAVEFPRAAREYPIVFGKDAEGNVFPVALLGLKKNQNVFVNKKGEWKADYVLYQANLLLDTTKVVRFMECPSSTLIKPRHAWPLSGP